MRGRHYSLLALLAFLIYIGKWVYCMAIIGNAFLTWHIHDINFLGTHGDGFDMHGKNLDKLPILDTQVNELVELFMEERAKKVDGTEDVVRLNLLSELEKKRRDTLEALKWGPELPQGMELKVPPVVHQ
ncbi:hypothetical protein BDK51DRAFT_48097, partial [Blyttiomyces helicus]